MPLANHSVDELILLGLDSILRQDAIFVYSLMQGVLPTRLKAEFLILVELDRQRQLREDPTEKSLGHR